MPPLGPRGKVPVKREPRKAAKPPPSDIFGPLHRADHPITRAQKLAGQRVTRAQRPILKRTSVPYVPKLAHPTSSQRAAAHTIVGTGLKHQGVTDQELTRLARGEGGKRKQQAVNRYLGAARTTQRRLEAGVAEARMPKGRPTPPMTFVDPLYRDAVVKPRLVPGQQARLAHLGRQLVAQRVAQASPYQDAHHRVPLPGATIDLTAASQAIGSRLADNPLSAFAKGMSQIATQRAFSDKTVLGRTVNDVLTYPAAAIPTAYELATNPGGLASGIVDQITHPVTLTKEHPLFGALLLHGGVSALGRTSGAIARSGALGKTLRNAAGTQRNMMGLAGESGASVRTPRSYSKDVFRKAAQVLYDKRLQPIRDAKGDVVKDARGRPVMAAPTKSVLNSPERLQRKRADFISSRANARERHARAEASRAAHNAQPVREHGGPVIKVAGRTIDMAGLGRLIDRSLASQPSTKARVLSRRFYRPEKDTVVMAMEGTLRSPETFHADLVKERARLEEAYKGQELDPLQKRTNRIRARTIDRVLKDPRALRNAAGVFASARTLAKHGNELTRRAVGQRLLSPDAAERAKLFPYAQSHMGAKVVEHSDGSQSLRAADGTFLSNNQIRSHMRDPQTGPVVNSEHIAYIPHRLDVRGARAYHQQFRLNRPNLDRESRTGAAYAAGATDSSFNAALEHMVHATTTLARAKEFDKLVGDVGIKHPQGRYFTWKEAEQYARHGGRAPNEATNARLPGEPQLVPVRAHAAKYDEERARAIQNEQDPSAPGASDRLVHEQTSRFHGPDPASRDARNVVLVPKVIADRLQENLKPSHSFDKAFQGATAAFRTTVLPFSTKWLTGNVVEAVLRSGIAGVSPHDPHVARKLIKEMQRQDPEVATEYLSHLLNGLLYGEKGLTVHRTAEDVAGKVGGTVAHSLPGRGALKAVKGVTDPIFAFNRGMEKTALYGALGKYARRQMQEMTGSWWKAMRAQDQAIKDLAKGMKGTDAQEAAARYLDETLGKYSRFSPPMRRVIQGYAPFLPWYLNSVKFVFHTLPVRHPVKLAVLTQAEAAFQKDWEQQHPGKAGQGSLKTAIPSHGGFVDASRFTPFGFPGPVAAGDTAMIASPLLPQLQGVTKALEGQDPFGNQLKVPPTGGHAGVATGGQKTAVALNQLVEGLIPLLGLGRRLREKGGKSYATSTILSPKTQPRGPGQPDVSGPNRIFNPFRPVYISASRAGGVGEVVTPRATRAQPKSRAQRDADFARRAVHGPGAGSVSSEDLDFIRRASRSK